MDRFELPNGERTSILVKEHPISEEDQHLLNALRQAWANEVEEGGTIRPFEVCVGMGGLEEKLIQAPVEYLDLPGEERWR